MQQAWVSLRVSLKLLLKFLSCSHEIITPFINPSSETKLENLQFNAYPASELNATGPHVLLERFPMEELRFR